MLTTSKSKLLNDEKQAASKISVTLKTGFFRNCIYYNTWIKTWNCGIISTNHITEHPFILESYDSNM